MQGKVSVGLSTVTGYGVSSAAFVGAVLAYLGGDHSNQQVAIIALGIIGALAFAITNIGRQRQAIALTKAGAAERAALPPITVTAGGTPAETRWLDLEGSGAEAEWRQGDDGVWVKTGNLRRNSVTVSNADAVVADPSLQADPSDLDGAGDHPVA